MDLTVENLACARGGVPVLGGVSFRVRPGQLLVLRGPNGCGKTTVLRTLAGLQPALSGTVSGAEGRVAYGAHADGIKATLSVSENLAFWAGVYGTKRVDAAIIAFELNGLLSRRAQNLSAGQKRRLGLARLLVTGRPLWVLDEPTVSLDDRGARLFADAVKTHLDGGGQAVVATHIDLGLAGEILDLSRYKANTILAKDVFDEAFE